MPIIVKDEIKVLALEKKNLKPEPNIEKEIVDPPIHYHIETHGDLHKMLNIKSDYLKDMIDFENNK